MDSLHQHQHYHLHDHNRYSPSSSHSSPRELEYPGGLQTTSAAPAPHEDRDEPEPDSTLLDDDAATAHSLFPSSSTSSPALTRPLTHRERELLAHLDRLKFFLATAPSHWSSAASASASSLNLGICVDPTGVSSSSLPLSHSLPSPTHPALNRFLLPSSEYVTCILWSGLYHITGTDIVRALVFRFEAFGRPVRNMKKFEEGVFSDLRNLKPGVDACLEEPKSPFLDLLFKYQCIRTQKKQKVFYWFSVPHDRLFLDALERDLKREKMGHAPTTEVVGEPALSFRYDPKRSLYEQFSKAQGGVEGEGELEAAVRRADEAAASVDRNGSVSRGPSDDDIEGQAAYLGRRLMRQQGEQQRRPDSAHSVPELDYQSSIEEPTAYQHPAEPATPPDVHATFGAVDGPGKPQVQGRAATVPGVHGFSMFTLFEGSPTYKQRRKKATTSKGASTSAPNSSSNSSSGARRTSAPPSGEHTPDDLGAGLAARGQDVGYGPADGDMSAAAMFTAQAKGELGLASAAARERRAAMQIAQVQAAAQVQAEVARHQQRRQMEMEMEHEQQRHQQQQQMQQRERELEHLEEQHRLEQQKREREQQQHSHAYLEPSTTVTVDMLASGFVSDEDVRALAYGTHSPSPMPGQMEVPQLHSELSVAAFAPRPIRPSTAQRHHSYPTSASTSSSTFNSNSIVGQQKTKAFVCPLFSCGRMFKRMEHLKRHLRTHTMEKPYQCERCLKKFSRSDNLNQHVRTHMRADAERGGGGGGGSGMGLGGGVGLGSDGEELDGSSSVDVGGDGDVESEELDELEGDDGFVPYGGYLAYTMGGMPDMEMCEVEVGGAVQDVPGDEEGLVAATSEQQQQSSGVDPSGGAYATDGGQDLYYSTDPTGVVSGQQFSQVVAPSQQASTSYLTSAPQGSQWITPTHQAGHNNLDSYAASQQSSPAYTSSIGAPSPLHHHLALHGLPSASTSEPAVGYRYDSVPASLYDSPSGVSGGDYVNSVSSSAPSSKAVFDHSSLYPPGTGPGPIRRHRSATPSVPRGGADIRRPLSTASGSDNGVSSRGYHPYALGYATTHDGVIGSTHSSPGQYHVPLDNPYAQQQHHYQRHQQVPMRGMRTESDSQSHLQEQMQQVLGLSSMEHDAGMAYATTTAASAENTFGGMYRTESPQQYPGVAIAAYHNSPEHYDAESPNHVDTQGMYMLGPGAHSHAHPHAHEHANATTHYGQSLDASYYSTTAHHPQAQHVTL